MLKARLSNTDVHDFDLSLVTVSWNAVRRITLYRSIIAVSFVIVSSSSSFSPRFFYANNKF